MHLIIGAGIIGMSIAKAIKERDPGAEIIILEKEPEVGYHASSYFGWGAGDSYKKCTA